MPSLVLRLSVFEALMINGLLAGMTTLSKTLSSALGRPSMAKAMMCSFLVHAGCILVLLSWSATFAARNAFTGKRNAVYVRAAYSERAISHPVEPIQWESMEEPSPSDKPSMQDATLTGLEIQPQQSRISKQPTSSEMQPVSDLAATLPTPSANPVRPRQTTAAATAQPVHRVPRATLPQPAIAASQPAGIEEQTPPNFAQNRPPAYPAAAIRNGFEGTVVLRLYISDRGSVDRVEIKKSSGHTILDRAAVAAVRTWRGEPARRGGRPIATVELLPVQFRL